MPIRARLTAGFGLGAFIAFAIGAWLFVAVLHSALLRSLDSSLAAEWTQLSQTVPTTSGQSNFQDPGGVAVGTSAGNGIHAAQRGTEYIVQLIMPNGTLQESNQAGGKTVLLNSSQRRLVLSSPLTVNARTPLSGSIRLFAAQLDRSHRILVVGASLGAINATLDEVQTALLIGGMVFVPMSALGAFGVASFALRPVERLRKEAAALSERDEHVELVVPSTKDEIAALAQTMNSILQRLQTALTRQRMFVSDAGHELRTPFAILQGELELATRPGRSKDDLVNTVKNSLVETERLVRLAEDLLLLAQSDENAIASIAELHPVEPVIAQAREHALGRAHAKGVSLRIAVHSQACAVFDPVRVRQILDNLIDNALRFAPANSEILITAQTRPGICRIEVIDEGPGFPPEFIPMAFERFARPTPARVRSQGGSGLGLAIVAALAASQGGSVRLGNGEKGALVVLEIPTEVT